jgi:putative two-component system response regulator
VENRDENTGGHVDRTSMYMKTLIEAMLDKGLYADEMLKWNLDSVISSARLHDVGKITIPDSILNKPGKLTEEEFDKMKTHSLEGERIIEKVIERTENAEFLRNAKIIAAHHHERWNGTGYPYALKGADIPLLGRVMAIIDVYDALVSERPYKKAFTHNDAVRIIMEESGSHFDPQIAAIFYEVNEQIASTREKVA